MPCWLAPNLPPSASSTKNWYQLNLWELAVHRLPGIWIGHRASKRCWWQLSVVAPAAYAWKNEQNNKPMPQYSGYLWFDWLKPSYMKKIEKHSKSFRVENHQTFTDRLGQPKMCEKHVHQGQWKAKQRHLKLAIKERHPHAECFASCLSLNQATKRYLGDSSTRLCRQDAAKRSKRSTPTDRSQRSKSSNMLKKT